MNDQQSEVHSSEIRNTCASTEGSTSQYLTQEEIIGSLVGHTRKTIEEMYELYVNHATALGFSVRKSTKRRITGSTVIKDQYYVCSFEGFKKQRNKKEETPTQTTTASPNTKKKKKPKLFPDSRTGCKAYMRVKLTEQGVYEVVHHVLRHNHDLTRPSFQHFHRSERNISEEKGKIIENMQKLGISAADSYRYMCAEAGEEEFVGHTMKDHINYAHRLKIKEIDGKDSQCVIDMLYQRDADEDDFFFRVRLDDQGRVTSLFWRDSMMKEDYEIYGDVTVFDTTYRTNRYNLICASFVGINNHWKNVMFACAFIGDEKTETFKWLFETFKKSMEGKTPISIFTDQDQAISNAIEEVLPNTRHRLCLWHLQQNAVSRFGELKNDDTFKDTFKKCLYKCVSEDEFNSTWDMMMQKYELIGHDWFERLYSLREKWCTALSKDFFSAGILSSQRSESTHNAIGFKANKTTSLTEFFHIYWDTIKRWRSTEKHDEFKCSTSRPSSFLPMNGLLRHAASVYTHTLFRDFEQEFRYAMCTQAKITNIDGYNIIYIVHPEVNTEVGQVVTYNSFEQTINCSCKNFEEAGWLCFHAPRVMNVHSITSIPEKYIIKRWTKYAKSEVWKKEEERESFGEARQRITPWRYTITRKCYNLILTNEDNEEARKILHDNYERCVQEINAILPPEKEVESTCSTSDNQDNDVLDPERAKTKGRSKRKKGHFEKSGQGKKQEFGTITPIPRLF